MFFKQRVSHEWSRVVAGISLLYKTCLVNEAIKFSFKENVK